MTVSYQQLDQAIQLLKEIAPTSERDFTLRTAAEGAVKSPDVKSAVRRALMRVIDGGTRAKDIVKTLNTYPSAEVGKVISIYYAGTGGADEGNLTEITNDASVNASPSSSDKSDTQIMMVQVYPADLTPANRSSDLASLFMTAIPTTELSRAVPYLDLKVITPRWTHEQNTPLSTQRFLFGTSKPTGLAADMLGASEVMLTDVNHASNLRDIDQSAFNVAGMELFTSPQTMVDANGNLSIDPFRPFMSLISVELEVAMTIGTFAMKTGKVEFVLHDRARMGDIADLIKPDMFQFTELLIEYGWSHPDSSGDNVYGILINGMRTREKYGVVNSSFAFTDDGQVTITLEISMKGVVDFSTVKISQSKDIAGAERVVEQLISLIAQVRRRPGIVADVLGASIVDSTSDISSALQVDGAILAEVRKLIGDTKNDNPPELEQLSELLKKLYGQQPGDGSIDKLKNVLANSYIAKMNSLGNGSPDPMLKKLSDNVLVNQDALTTSGNFVSLGKLFLRYVAEPLTSTGNFTEVHVIFYCFNASAGAVRHINIGSFPINVNDFKTEFAKFIEKRGRFSITLKEFIDYVINNYLDDYTNAAYGMSSIGFNPSKFNEEGERLTADITTAEATSLETKMSEQMKSLGITDGKFVPPIVNMHVECVPLGDPAEGELRENTPSILRIHIHDAASTPYPGIKKLLDTMLDRNVGTFGQPNIAESDASAHMELTNQVLQDAETSAHLIRKETDSLGNFVYVPIANPAKIKKYISDAMPTIRYGTNSGGVKGITVTSLHDSSLASVSMQRMGFGDPSNMPGVDGDIVPLYMIPTELELQTMGCPVLMGMQQFFVDLDTNTTIDNIYAIISCTHRIEQGSFESSVKMNSLDAYGTYRSAFNAVQQSITDIEKSKESKGS